MYSGRYHKYQKYIPIRAAHGPARGLCLKVAARRPVGPQMKRSTRPDPSASLVLTIVSSRMNCKLNHVSWTSKNLNFFDKIKKSFNGENFQNTIVNDFILLKSFAGKCYCFRKIQHSGMWIIFIKNKPNCDK